MGRVLGILGLLVLVILVGSMGYIVIEELAPIDAIYMTVMTITTLGFTEVQPLSDYGKIFTIFLVFVGLGVVAMFTTHIVEVIIRQTIETHSKSKEIQTYQDKDFTDFFNFITPDKELQLGIIKSNAFYSGKTKAGILRDFGFIIIGIMNKAGDFNLNIPMNRKIRSDESFLIMASTEQLKNARSKKPKQLF